MEGLVPSKVLVSQGIGLMARVAELVDAGDLKSPGVAPRAGSSPAPGTRNSKGFKVPLSQNPYPPKDLEKQVVLYSFVSFCISLCLFVFASLQKAKFWSPNSHPKKEP